jgi:hypothetical protein
MLSLIPTFTAVTASTPAAVYQHHGNHHHRRDNGGSATNADLNSPTGVAVDGAGSLSATTLSAATTVMTRWVSARWVSGTEIDVTWSAVSNAREYEVMVTTSGYSQAIFLHTTIYQDTSVSPGYQYSYDVSVLTASGWSPVGTASA